MYTSPLSDVPSSYVPHKPSQTQFLYSLTAPENYLRSTVTRIVIWSPCRRCQGRFRDELSQIPSSGAQRYTNSRSLYSQLFWRSKTSPLSCSTILTVQSVKGPSRILSKLPELRARRLEVLLLSAAPNSLISAGKKAPISVSYMYSNSMLEASLSATIRTL